MQQHGDSMLVVEAFKSIDVVPWYLQNRWKNYLSLMKDRNFVISHIYREGNCCTNKLTSFEINVNGFVWWDGLPSFVRSDFSRNRLGFPNYRFC